MNDRQELKKAIAKLEKSELAALLAWAFNAAKDLGLAASSEASPAAATPVRAGVFPVGPKKKELGDCTGCDRPLSVGKWGKPWCFDCWKAEKEAEEACR